MDYSSHDSSIGGGQVSRTKRNLTKGQRRRSGRSAAYRHTSSAPQAESTPMLPVGSNFAERASGGPYFLDGIPAVIRAELNADIDRDLLDRMRALARDRRMLQPDITDKQMADYLALAEGFGNFARWLGARRGAVEVPFRASAAWLVGTLAILFFLTAMLIIAIAIAV